MSEDGQLNQMCEQGQRLLTQTRYLEALRVLMQAEQQAWQTRRWELLGRLYMPLQETRRQIRQRCGEGRVCLDLLAGGRDEQPEAEEILARFSAGQLLVAGWGSIEPALQVRHLAAQRGLYLETFLGAVYPASSGRIIVVTPTEQTVLAAEGEYSAQELAARVGPNCLMMYENDLPRGVREGSQTTYAQVMAIWERLHQPFLAAADAQEELLARMQGYRQAIAVDYACELAHQKFSDAARQMARR